MKILTVAQLIEPKDDLVTIDIRNGLHHIKIHSLYCPQEPFNDINYKKPLTLHLLGINLYGYAAGVETKN